MNKKEMDQEFKTLAKSGNVGEFDMADAPLSFSKTKADGSKPIFLGWEWEVSIPECTFNVENYDEVNIYKGKGHDWLRKAHSLPIRDKVNFGDGGSPIEMRSIPATLAYHKEYLKKEFFAEGLNSIFQKSTGCGMHVHMDKRAFTDESLKKFVAFICNPSNRSFIESICGRTIGKQARWCAANPVEFNYIEKKYLAKIYANDRLSKKIVGCSFDPDDDQFGKGVAVNLCTDYDTYELRIFNSPRSEQKFMKSLEFTDALIRFAKEVSFLELYAKDFCKYVYKNRASYAHLMKEPAIYNRLYKKRKLKKAA